MQQNNLQAQFREKPFFDLSAFSKELHKNGYIVINFLEKEELQALLKFDQDNLPPNDLLISGMSFSAGTSELSYRRAITQQIKNIFSSKLAKLLPKYRVLLCNLVRKIPDKLYSEMPLHQDPSLVDENILTAYGVWCPLIDVNKQNGCLQVVEKSHLLNSNIRLFFTFEGFLYSQNMLSIMQQNYLTSIPMQAGQALIYDKRLFHGSLPNVTDVERVAAVCSLVPKEILSHFCYRETSTSSKVELFEVEDEFYDRYIVGQHPEDVNYLGTFDYEVEPLTPEILIEKLGAGKPPSKIPNWANAQIRFQPQFLANFDLDAQKIVVLVSNEFEGFSKNGGIGTYYTTLSQKLASDGWTVILLLCQTDVTFQGNPSFDTVHHVFSTHETTQVLSLQPIHQHILATTQQSNLGRSFDEQSFCCLFFLQALIDCFPDAVIYAEFPEIWGFGYRTIQAKQSGLLGNSCLIGVTSHGSFEWLNEVNSQYSTKQASWLWQAFHYEQFSYEKADVTHFPSYFLRSKFASYGWKTAHAKHLPYFVPNNPYFLASTSVLVEKEPEILSFLPKGEENRKGQSISVIFFGRLEERKGLCTFLEAMKLLDSTIASQIHFTFIGKIIPLQSSHLQHLNSQQYIERELGNAFAYTLLSNLSSQEAIQAIADLHHPIVCLTSLQENFPNTALEMGQLPVSLVVSDTGGFRETLELLDRSSAVHWFQPGNAYGLAQALTQAIHTYPEKPKTIDQISLDQINHHLLNQRLELMSQAFIEAAPKEPIAPTVTIALVCWHSAKGLLECLTSLTAQTYEHLNIMVLFSDTDPAIQGAIAQAQTQFPESKYLASQVNWSLGEAYNHLVEQSTGEYVLIFSPNLIASPDMVDKMITAICETDAVVVVCPQLIAAGEEPEAIVTLDGNLLKLLDFNHCYDLTALFSKALLKEFRYCEERGLQALNWQIFAAAIATDQAIIYYPYPLYSIHPDSPSKISPASFAKERYYLRQYLFQIKPAQWNQRQINLLLTGFEQLVQSPLHQSQQNQFVSPQDQAWMITAQQMQQELTQAQTRLEELENWNRELQTGKEWLESQWQSWMLKAQKFGVDWEQARSLIQQMQGSKFWKLRHYWLKLKQKLGHTSTDPLQLPVHTLTPGVQEFVARIAGQEVRFFQPTATQSPVVSIISSCSSEYEYLETTYRSIVNQTLQNFEWIIIDDGSTHFETKSLLASLSQRTAKIRILSHANHQGRTASYNQAITEAKGKYLCFVDIGSILDPTYVEKCVLFLETHPQVSVVNSYLIVFQSQEHWWQPHLNQLTSLLEQKGVMGHPLYRKADFERLGGFEESLNGFADWERILKAIAHHQVGWTIPEYLDCYRSTQDNAPVAAQHPDYQQTIATIHSRYQTFFTNSSVISLEPQPLQLDRLNFTLNLENPHLHPVAGKRILLFCDALDNSEVAKWNCDLVILLEKCGHAVTIVTTSTSNHSCQEFFYQATPDIFHLPNLFDRAHWLAFIGYILQSRQIESIVISGSEIAYSFLPLLRLKFPKISLIDYIYPYSSPEQSSRAVNLSCQFTEDLQCQILPSQRLAKAHRSLNPSASTKIKVCYSQSEIEAILSNAIGLYKTAVQAYPSIESETEALLLILESLQQE